MSNYKIEKHNGTIYLRGWVSSPYNPTSKRYVSIEGKTMDDVFARYIDQCHRFYDEIENRATIGSIIRHARKIGG